MWNVIGALVAVVVLAAIFFFAPSQVYSVAPAQVSRVIPCDPKVGDEEGNDCPCAFLGNCKGYDKHNKPLAARPHFNCDPQEGESLGGDCPQAQPAKEAAKPAAPHKPIYRRVLKSGHLDGEIDCKSVPLAIRQLSHEQILAAARSYGLSMAQIEKFRVCLN
jgi:hypothetical protein